MEIILLIISIIAFISTMNHLDNFYDDRNNYIFQRKEWYLAIVTFLFCCFAIVWGISAISFIERSPSPYDIGVVLLSIIQVILLTIMIFTVFGKYPAILWKFIEDFAIATLFIPFTIYDKIKKMKKEKE